MNAKIVRTLLAMCLLMPVLALAQQYPTPTFNSLTLQTPLSPSNGGTGASNSGTLSLSGNLSTSGGFPLSWSLTGNTSLTLPTSGILANQSYVQSTASNPETPVSVGTSLYPSIGGPVSTTATTTSGSAIITVTNATGISVGMGIYGSFVPNACSDTLVGYFYPYVVSISGTAVTMSCNAIATNSSPVTVQFGQQRWSTTSTVLANDVGAQTLKVGQAAQGNTAGWLNQISTGEDYRTVAAAQILSEPGGGYGLVLGSRTSDSTGGAESFPLNSFFYADNWAANVGGENAYFQSVLSPATAGSTSHIQMEQSINSLWPTVGENPYNINGVNSTVAHRLDCGTGQTGTSPNNCGVAMDIVPNPAAFQYGIMIANNAINTSGGTTVGNALAMPLMDGIVWFGSSSAYSASIYSPSGSNLDFSLNTGGTASFLIGGTSFLGISSTEIQPIPTNSVSLGDSSHVFSNVNASSVSTGSITATGASSAGSYSTTGPISTGTLTATGAITPSTTAGIVGTTTANNANAGSVGEYQSTSASATSLITATPGSCASLTLTAGDWDVTGTVQFIPASTTVITSEQASINTVATSNGPNYQSQTLVLTHAAGSGDILNTGNARINVSTSTTVYAVGDAAFNTSTLTCNGYIHARRVR